MPVPAIVIFEENGVRLVSLLCPSDGYPAGIGLDVAEMIAASGNIIINELPVQVISTLHNQADGLCLLPFDAISSWSGYLYRVNSMDGCLSISIEHDGVVLFNGTAADCLLFIHETT